MVFFGKRSIQSMAFFKFTAKCTKSFRGKEKKGRRRPNQNNGIERRKTPDFKGNRKPQKNLARVILEHGGGRENVQGGDSSGTAAQEPEAPAPPDKPPRPEVKGAIDALNTEAQSKSCT